MCRSDTVHCICSLTVSVLGGRCTVNAINEPRDPLYYHQRVLVFSNCTKVFQGKVHCLVRVSPLTILRRKARKRGPKVDGIDHSGGREKHYDVQETGATAAPGWEETSWRLSGFYYHGLNDPTSLCTDGARRL